MARTGLSLLEVLLAATIMVLAFVPLVGTMTASSSETATACEALTATHLAGSVISISKATPTTQRVALSAVKATQLSHIRPLLDAHRIHHPATATAVEGFLDRFATSTTLDAARTDLTVAVDWSQAGQSRKYEVRASLGDM